MTLLRREAARHPAIEGVLRQPELDVRQRLPQFLLVEVVARGEDDRHAELSADRGVDLRLSNRLAVHADLDDLATEDRLVADTIRVAGAGVVAEEEDGIGVLHSFDHAQMLVETFDQLGARDRVARSGRWSSSSGRR